MSILNIFDQDAFHVVTMSQAMREIKYKPGFITKMGLFETDSIDTTEFAIEIDEEEQMVIVRSSPRGGPGQTIGKGKRKIRKLPVPHFQIDDSVYADEIQNVRAFGDERAVETFQGRMSKRAIAIRQSFALTEEFHRLNVVISGKMLDADNSVIFDFYDEFEEAAASPIDWDLDNASPATGALRQRGTDLTRAIGASLGGLPFSGLVAFAGDNFFDALVKHKEVYETYKNYSAARELRNAILSVNNQSASAGAWAEIDLFNIHWINYRGSSEFGISVPTDEARVVPMGVPGLFKSVYAPADYIETVNTMGLEMYAKMFRMPNDKGMFTEHQQNVVHYCTRPRVIRKLTLT